MSNTAEQVRSFIRQNFLFNDQNRNLDDNESFLEGGIIDSTGVIEVVSWIEEQFNFTVDDEDLVPEKFDTVSNLARYIEGKAGTP